MRSERGTQVLKGGKPPSGANKKYLSGYLLVDYQHCNLYKLRMTTEEDLRWLKKEFVSVWKATPANMKSLPQSNTPEYEHLQAVRW